MISNKQQTINYQMVSFLQFLFSILVIALHCTKIFNNDVLHFIQKSFFSRMAVPYFIVSSSFFIALKIDTNPNYLKQYRLKTIKKYLFWSVLFTPYGYFYFQTTNIDSHYLLVGLLFALIYTGTCYHLWYIPALLFATFLTDKLIKITSWACTFLILFILYTIGTVETYSLIIKDTPFFPIYSFYKQVLFTTRNGLFFTPIFVLIGFLSYRYLHQIKKINSRYLLIFTSCLFSLEATFIFFNQGDDKNFYLTLIPFSFSLFYWSITTGIFKTKNFKMLKEMSVLFFYIHPLFIEIFALLLQHTSLSPAYLGANIFVVTTTCCLASYFIKNKLLQSKSIVLK